MYTILFDEAEERGEIKGTIKLYNDEMGLSPQEIVAKIMNRYPSLKESEAKQYVKNTLSIKQM